MKQLRQRDNLRYFSSFLLALLLHSLLLFLGYGMWGQNTNQLQVTRIYSQLVEVENTKISEKTTPQEQHKEVPETPLIPKEQEKKDPPPTAAQEDKVETKAQTTELSQNQPAPREIPPVEKEKPLPSAEETPSEPEETVVEETPVEPAAPPLPSLGNGLGMIILHKTSYPKDLSDQGIEGVIQVVITINEEGKLLKEPEIIKSSGIPELDAHCLLTIEKRWKFKPSPRPYRLWMELQFINDKVEGPYFLKEAAYLSPEEGGNSE